jgi:hypothetical protein
LEEFNGGNEFGVSGGGGSYVWTNSITMRFRGGTSKSPVSSTRLP